MADPALRRHRVGAALPAAVVGFEAVLVARDDHGTIAHCELRWPEGGSVLFGSAAHSDSVHGSMRPGSAAMYVPTADVDAIARRARDGEAEVVSEPADTMFGSGDTARAFTLRDHEGYLWTFGTYRGRA